MKIGVLALQGDAAEHVMMLERLGVAATVVRLPAHLRELDGLIMPGGESTTIGKLVIDYDLVAPLREFAQEGAIWGTCAGAILMAKDSYDTQPVLGIMGIGAQRNAYGRQLNSFEAELNITTLGPVVDTDKPYRAIFIRAPHIKPLTSEVRILATLPDERVVAAQQGRLLATCFHPELTDDTRFHEYFLSLVNGSPGGSRTMWL